MNYIENIDDNGTITKVYREVEEFTKDRRNMILKGYNILNDIEMSECNNVDDLVIKAFYSKILTATGKIFLPYCNNYDSEEHVAITLYNQNNNDFLINRHSIINAIAKAWRENKTIFLYEKYIIVSKTLIADMYSNYAYKIKAGHYNSLLKFEKKVIGLCKSYYKIPII